jgi:hypothetical protein
MLFQHGFSTIERSADLRKTQNDAGFTATTELSDEPKAGDIMLVEMAVPFFLRCAA